MVSTAATSLRDALEQRLQELAEAVAGLDDAAASRRPGESDWCVKEVLSHLCGDEGDSVVASLKRFLDEDTPLIGIVAGLPYYLPKRQTMSAAELLTGVRAQYGPVVEFVAGLSDEELSRRARIPLLKDSPLGDTPTLSQWVGALINFHLPDHINQIRSARG